MPRRRDLGALAATLWGLAWGCSGTSAVVSDPDAGFVADLGKPDVGNPEVGSPDAVSPDAVSPDAVSPDAVSPDVVSPDVVSPDVVSPDAGLRCRDNTDCAGNEFGYRVCDAPSGRCVPCTATNRGSCTAGQYCTAANRCEAGCANDLDCAAAAGDGGVALRCDTARNTCVGCTADEQCALGQLCMAGACVAGCNERRGCPANQGCCGGACFDVQSDPMRCGTCTTVCAGGNNAAPTCTMGACTRRCLAGFADCDGDTTNGCEVSLAGTAHCGACGNACAAGPNSTAACVMGACRLSCATGFADCDMNPLNGCEVNVLTAAGHCGACGRVCAGGANGSGSCVAGACAVTCNPGFGDCDGNAANGCEASLDRADTCGRCGNACSGATPVCTAPPGATAVCTSGCPTGQRRCGDACVDPATDTANCGACGNACRTSANTRATCAQGVCGTTCAPGFGDCDGDATNGCEVNTQVSATHCGACGTTCRAGQNATVACVSSVCRASCNLGFGDCDGLELNGCEANLLTATAHCGGCGRACPAAANAVPVCADGGCSFRCVAGFADCDGNASNGCEAALDTASNCGRCGNACGAAAPLCSTAGTSPSCISGCASNQVRCGNSCVDLQTDVTDCGACGNACPSGPNATRSCAAGRCGLSCATGFGDCDGMAASGCEANLATSDAHCGACGRACPAGQACTAGTCRDRCAPGLSFCAGGCVNPQSDNAHCGACGNACGDGQSCLAGVCRAGNVSTVASGNDHVCAIRGTGTVWCWGYNGWGQIGNGTTTSALVLQQVQGISTAVEVAASGGSSFARLADGSVVAWGLNYGTGELGDGTMVTQRTSPVPVTGLRNIVDLSGGGWAHTCAAAADGQVWCWGYNAYGQLGDGSLANRVAPGLVAGINSAVEVCTGYLHSCARLADGTLRCWGYNGNGQLGTGTTANAVTSVAVVGMSNAVEIACGTNHTCARRADGTVLCWGYNAYGQLGDGTTNTRYAIGLVAGLTDAVEIGTGEDVWRGNQSGSSADRTCARRANGTVLCWGYNGYGGVGDGTTTNRVLPTAVLGLTNVVELDAAGRYHTCARRADRTIFCWGYGGNGQMGDGTANSRNSPGLVVGFP